VHVCVKQNTKEEKIYVSFQTTENQFLVIRLLDQFIQILGFCNLLLTLTGATLHMIRLL